jgi:anti-sigma regulatory factor (Ser/Thr protein kinase)
MNEQVRRRSYRSDPDQLAAVRRFVAECLPGCPALDDAILLFDEVAGNAMTHTASETVEVVVRHTDEVVRGEVYDQGANQVPTRVRLPEPQSESGRGLFLVELLAKEWGTGPTSTGKVVWFELYAPGCGLSR